ncbi:MAG: hypothetical protein AVDCRST_MAG75-3278 [uncultured Propionibacteriaceae bacterium]|uniref:Uncharacterized protein n=1 Tax=uncultured Propionibacteriaceae bacterium TaxID=257457 RepID=A0A6J4PKD0_9ACTN|nr:MAG: hypothetical protein AVDCRST_MAG75-3278 [uncultured Propionibacteriaceae bacterium]
MGRAWAEGCLIGPAFGLVWLFGLIVLYAFAVGEVHDPTREPTSTSVRLSVLLWWRFGSEGGLRDPGRGTGALRI